MNEIVSHKNGTTMLTWNTSAKTKRSLLALSAAAFLAVVPSACISADTAKALEHQAGPSLAGNYLASQYAQNRNDMSAALTYLDAVLEKDPDNLLLQRRAFILLLSEGRLNEAMPIARNLVKSDQTAPIAHLALPIDDMARGQYDTAIESLKSLPAGGVNTLVSPLVKAWALAGQDKFDEAIKAVSALSKHTGAGPLERMHVGLIHGLAGNAEASIEAYQKAAKAQGGLSLRLVLLLGNELQRNGQIDDARTLYQAFAAEIVTPHLITPALAQLDKGTKVMPLVTTPAMGLAEGLFGIADSMRQQNARETAVLFGRLVLHLRPGFPEALLMMGSLMEDDGQRKKANAFYTKIPAASPLSWSVRIRIADNLDVLKRTDEALALLSKMSTERPNDPSPLIDKADILRRHDRHDEAIKTYDQALERIDTPEKNDWVIFYSRGISYEQSDQWSKAEADFLTALSMQPDQPLVLNYLGYSWIEKGLNLERALDMVKKAVNLRPGDGYIVDSLGWGLYQLGRYEDSVREMERAVLLRAHDPVLSDHLGDAYWQTGRKREARFQWKRVLSFDPDDAVRASVEKKLKSGLPKP